jgi:hypothetical protein
VSHDVIVVVWVLEPFHVIPESRLDAFRATRGEDLDLT